MPEATIPDGSVVITPTQQYSKLEAVEKGLDALTAAVTSLTATVTTQATSERKTLDDHETRLRAVERRMWMATGVAAFLGSGGAVLATRFLGG